ncbi:efflux RND transporter periplasmic adaptor subunit [Acidithiobacillus montserratensis]|uniref:Efflux RND transporter periplasmic adaptor subunit n=1 Tax=Acidithiobacillus montserratensis TaxID=2729135 RepID=A0ACD5HFS9_9PROT|nr:efflux RND transporter periplasmic adaptor subunit [Acidithiobacillaceae bacterium]MBU2748038.1 efflux RND transporter periplasmic adaptor subunit [Acidithiobacillus montserratensis]
MSRYPLILLLSATVMGLAGCQGKARHEIPPLQVELVSPRVQNMTHYVGYLGTVTPMQTATIIPQTSGLLQRVTFTQGTMVSKGQILFTIDPAQTRAALAQAQAKLAADQATAYYNHNLVEQDRPLAEKDFITRQSFDQAVSQAQAASAQVAEDQAAVQQARINLSYTQIVAPISGRIGLALVKAGNLVVANQTQLTTINQISPITINFSVPQAELDAARQAQQQGTLLPITNENGGHTLDQGKLTFIDNTVSANTATVNLQATVPNTDLKLWPGQYVQVQMPVQHVENALVLPVGAVQQGSSGPFVYAIDQGKASDKSVQVLWETGAQAVISGIPSTAQVIYPLPARIYPGAAVQVLGKDSSHRHTHSGKAS